MPRMTPEELRKEFVYDRENGRFLWSDAPMKDGRPRHYAGREAGGLSRHGYRVIQFNGFSHLVHRLVWLAETGDWPEGIIDHRDRDRLNNRFDNLRLATKAENVINGLVRRDSTSGIRGVSWHSGAKKWRAHIGIGGRTIHLGFYATKEEGAAVRKAAEIKHYGDFSPA